VTATQQLFRGHGEVAAGKVIIGLNVAVWLVMTLLSAEPYQAAGPVFQHGALFGPYVAEGEWWRLVTGAFLHSGVMHLGFNMLLLWFLAQEMEPVLGPWRFTLVYSVSLAGGALGVMLLSPNQPTVGASGAVFGLMGALVVLQVRAKQNPWRSGILGLVLVNVLFTFAVPGISVGGHLGGLLVGAVTGAVVPFRRVPEQGDALRHVVLAGLGVLCLVAAVLAARAALPDLVPTVRA